MNESYCVYIHTSPSGKRYVGITGQNPERRWSNGTAYRKKTHFGSAIKKYGFESFSHDIVFEGLTREAACIEERRLIKQYDTTNPNYGYNSSSGGEGISGVKLTKEVRQKIANAHRGKTLTEQHKKKISESVTGRFVSDETKQKLREANLGKKLSDEHRKKLSDAKAGKCVHTAEHYQKLSEAFSGVPRPEEVKRKISQSKIGSTRKSLRKRILNVTTATTYESVTAASVDTGVNASHIADCARGRKYRKSAGGYEWRYI